METDDQTTSEPTNGQDDLAERLTGDTTQEQLINYGPPVVGIVSVFLTWATFSAPFIGSYAGNGLDLRYGWIVLFCAIGFLAAVHMQSDRGQLVTSIVALATVIWTYIRISQGFSQFRAETSGELFASSVDLGLGIGIHLAFVASLTMAYLGYKRNPDAVERGKQTIQQLRN